MAKNKFTSFKYFYGIPHAHTAFSTGRGTPLEAFEYAKNNRLNFLAITDHNSHLAKELYTTNQLNSKWQTTLYMSEKFKKKNTNLIPIVGFETKTAIYGDFNILNSNTYFTGIINNINLLALWMINNPNSVITINHPHKNINLLDYNELLNKLITSIEVGNGSFPNKYVRHDKYYYSLLDKGWKLGAINGQDNHRINFGDSENLTVILAPTLNISNIIEAFRLRRTYSTESRTLKFYFTINNTFMGDILPSSSNTLLFKIYADDPKVKINQIDIISNNGSLIKKIDNLHLNSIKYMYKHTRELNETWYVVKVYQDNNRIAISSPIFIS